jgi:hypothetical protein
MSSRIVDAFTSPWIPDPSGRWSCSVDASAGHLGTDGLGMVIRAVGDSSPAAASFAERNLSPPLDLRDADELRFWLRAARRAAPSPATPFYLAFEAASEPPVTLRWTRLLPVEQAGVWELHRLWLDDMPSDLRGAVGFLRLRALAPAIPFSAAIDDLIAVTPEPLQDADAALQARLHNRFEVSGAGGSTLVAALIHPSDPVPSDAPYILITPWSVTPAAGRPGADLVDNFTPGGAFVRAAPEALTLEYRLEVHATTRDLRAYLLEAVLAELGRDRRLVVAGEPVALSSFTPAPEQAALVPPGRTPLYYRLSVPLEIGRRRFHQLPDPSLVVAPTGGRDTAETVPV